MLAGPRQECQALLLLGPSKHLTPSLSPISSLPPPSLLPFSQVVYERALAAFPVTHYLWLQYAAYLEAHLKIPALISAAYQRAGAPGRLWQALVWAAVLGRCALACELALRLRRNCRVCKS